MAETETIQTPQPGIEPGSRANAADALPLSQRDKRLHQPSTFLVDQHSALRLFSDLLFDVLLLNINCVLKSKNLHDRGGGLSFNALAWMKSKYTNLLLKTSEYVKKGECKDYILTQ